MDVLSICRICLIENVNMQILNNVSLQKTYEKLTEIPFVGSDRRPLKVCYICYTKLRNCYQLQTSCLQSEELLYQMLKNNELKPQLQDAKRLKIVHPVIQFSVGPQEQNGYECASENVSYVKMEPSELSLDVSVKEEELEDESDIVNDEMIVHLQPKELLEYDELDINADEDFSIQNQESNGNLISNEDLCMNDNINLYYRPQAVEIQGVPVPKAMSLENSQIVYGRKPKIEENESMVVKIPSIYNTNVQQSSLNICVKEVASAQSLICDTCGKCFNRRCNLSRHVLIHSGEKRHKCDVCDKRFYRKNDLTHHNRIHFGEPYKCDLCARCFYRKSDLNNHIRIHSGVKPFKCNVCGMCFNLKGDLNRHIRTHTGDRPYKCNVCEKSFGRKSDVVVHDRIHTGEKPFKCKICRKCFISKTRLNKHNMLTHS